ncbi:MAG: DUF697 domain-containing protein [Bacillota bacterium]
MPKKTFWILILIGVLILLLFVVLSNIMDVGLKLREIHRYFEYAFYGLSFILIYLLILNPLRIIFFAPTFTVSALSDEKQNTKSYRNAAKNLLKMDTISDTDRTLLQTTLNDQNELPNTLKTVYHGTIRKQVDDIIIKHAKTVLMTTAISQNGNLDMFSVIFTNIKMIKAIVVACGFRPSYLNLGKLSANVAVTAMIAEGLEDVDFNELLPSKVGEALSDIPIVRTATNSIFQGISNGMLTCRIGIVTRKYLFRDNQMMTEKELRLAAYKESFRLMPIIIKDGLVAFPKGVINMAMRPFKRRTNKGND